MPNKNPVKVNMPSEDTEFLIPAEYANTKIYLTLMVDIKEDGWVYAAGHSIYLDTLNLYPQKSPEPVDLKLKYAHELKDLRLAIVSHVSCFFENGETDKTPTINYTLILEAGDVLLDKFQAKSTDRDVSRFRSLIIFKLQQ